MGPKRVARKARQPAPVVPFWTPWTLCIWRGETERCHFALVRMEYDPVHGPGPNTLKGIEAMFVDTTGGVAWKRYPPMWRTKRGDLRSTLELAIPTMVKTTVAEFLAYFKQRLLLVGGHPKAYETFGLKKPVFTTVETEPDPEKNKELNAMYVRAAKLLDVEEEDLRKRYAHMNRGLQSMALRNRLRAKGHNV